jgi:glucan 1,3-beta-glucosidase
LPNLSDECVYKEERVPYASNRGQHSFRPIFDFNMLFATVVSCLSLIACAHARALDGSAIARPSSSAVEPQAKHTSSPSLTSTSSLFRLETPAVNVDATSNDAPYWLADIRHQGIAAFNSNPSSYTVFRNVKDYGAKGKTR